MAVQVEPQTQTRKMTYADYAALPDDGYRYQVIGGELMLKIITEANVQGAPDLIAEVLSPSSVRLDRGPKRELYARFGVREYWLVSPEAETIEVLVLRGQAYERLGLFGSGDQVSSEVLSGLTLKTDAVFER